jgi:hypothetical protein
VCPTLHKQLEWVFQVWQDHEIHTNNQNFFQTKYYKINKKSYKMDPALESNREEKILLWFLCETHMKMRFDANYESILLLDFKDFYRYVHEWPRIRKYMCTYITFGHQVSNLLSNSLKTKYCIVFIWLLILKCVYVYCVYTYMSNKIGS